SGPFAVLETWKTTDRSAVLPKAAESTNASLESDGEPPPEGGLTRSFSLQVASRIGRPSKTPVATQRAKEREWGRAELSVRTSAIRKNVSGGQSGESRPPGFQRETRCMAAGCPLRSEASGGRKN